MGAAQVVQVVAVAVADAIIAEGKQRNYLPAQILAVLTLAIDEQWTSTEGLGPLLAKFEKPAIPTVDPWYNLAQLRGQTPPRWQAFKTRLHAHIRAALALINHEDDLLPALSDAEQRELLSLLRSVKASADVIAEDVKQIRAQLGPRAHVSWPSLGLNAKGEELTLRDAFGVMKSDVAEIKKQVSQ